MKSYRFVLIVMLALMGFSSVASATDITQGSYTPMVTTNADVDATGELIWPEGPTACKSVSIYNTPGAVVNDIIFIAEIESTVDTTAAASLPSWGLPLYPLPASGPITSFTYTAPAVDSSGAYYPFSSRYWYAAAGGINSRVAMSCLPCRVRSPKNSALCLP